MTSLQLLQDVGLLFRKVNFNFREQVDRALRSQGLGVSFGHVSALAILSRRPGINGAELARHCMVSAQAMNNVLRTLATRKLLDRRAHPGSLRADAWHVTAKGAALLERSRDTFGVVMSRMLSPLTAQEQRDFERFLRLCATSLEDSADARAEASAGSRAKRAGTLRRRSPARSPRSSR